MLHGYLGVPGPHFENHWIKECEWNLYQLISYLTGSLQLLSGATKEQRENLGVTTPDYYFYLNQSATYTVEDISDKKEFSDTMV